MWKILKVDSKLGKFIVTMVNDLVQKREYIVSELSQADVILRGLNKFYR